MKIKSTKEKMRGHRFVNFSQVPHDPFTDKREVNKPIITKKEFRQLQDGKTIDVNPSQCDMLDKRCPGVFKIFPVKSEPVNGDSKADSKPELNTTIENAKT